MSEVSVHDAAQFSVHQINVEKRRGYVYPDDIEFIIENPDKLYLKRDARGDSHRVTTKDGRTYYPARGWIAIWWENFPGNEPVAF